MTDPFILLCAPNGARRQKTDHQALPLTPDELAECAEEVYCAGVSILHLHVRDKKGAHTLAPEHYRPALEAIEQRVGKKLLIQITTEAVGVYERDEQMAVVKALKPEAVSIALREICAAEQHVAETAVFFGWMQRENIFPQIILYDEQDVLRFLDLQARGVFSCEMPFVLCVLGRHSPEGTQQDAAFKKYLDLLSGQKLHWAVCGFGKAEHQLPARAARLGGHVRVGFENNIWRSDGTPADNNTELVVAAKCAAKHAGRTLASADEVREMFALAKV